MYSNIKVYQKYIVASIKVGCATQKDKIVNFVYVTCIVCNRLVILHAPLWKKGLLLCTWSVSHTLCN